MLEGQGVGNPLPTKTLYEMYLADIAEACSGLDTMPDFPANDRPDARAPKNYPQMPWTSLWISMGMKPAVPDTVGLYVSLYRFSTGPAVAWWKNVSY